MIRKRLLAVLLVLAGLSMMHFVRHDFEPRDPLMRQSAAKIARMDTLRRGVNILGYDGVWDGWSDAPFEMSDFDRIRDAGFDHVRVNFFGFRFMDKSGRLDPKVLARLDRVLDQAFLRGLTVVLDQHDNTNCQRAKPECKTQLVSFWRQIASRYRNKRPEVVYELLNEPGGHMKHEQWNETLAAALAAVREVEPQRRVIVAALNGEDARDIDKLSLPAQDRNLIVTVHYYAPMQFTHQGAPWAPEFRQPRSVDWGAPADRSKVDEDFGIVARWAEMNDRPIYLGEFGVYDAAPLEARAAWLSYVARAAERRGWGWAVWQFDHDFSLFDHESRSWRQPLLRAVTGR